MELAVKELDNVVKAMSRKVIKLEEELVNVKDSINSLFLNKTKEGLGHQEMVREKVNDFKEDIYDKDFNPKSVSSPKYKDIGFVVKVKKDEVKKDKIFM